MVLESSPTPAPNSNTKYHVEVETGIPQDNSPELGENHKDSASITKDDTQRLRSTEKSDLASHDELEPVVNRSKKSIRIGVTIFGFCMLVLGRLGVPEVEVPCVQDRVLDALAFANTFILKPGNEVFRDGFQLLCSIFVDITCLITFIYWIRKGTSYRLPLTLIFFYIVRALVQNMWVSPFTTGYYWESPGIPSLVVPYGRGSDFFFSGHTGFMIICTLEWHYIGMKKVRNFVAAAAAYTMLILLVYRIHYSIDIFTGAIFAEWAFIKVDHYKHEIADVIGSVFNKALWCFRGKYKEAYKGM